MLSLKCWTKSVALDTACGYKPSEDFLSRNAAAMTRRDFR
jgi:hypothetical protein